MTNADRDLDRAIREAERDLDDAIRWAGTIHPTAPLHYKVRDRERVLRCQDRLDALRQQRVDRMAAR